MGQWAAVVLSQQGFAPFRDQWEQLDGLKGCEITVYGSSGAIVGTAVGINPRGALMLDTGSEVLSLHSGEVSLNKNNIE